MLAVRSATLMLGLPPVGVRLARTSLAAGQMADASLIQSLIISIPRAHLCNRRAALSLADERMDRLLANHLDAVTFKTDDITLGVGEQDHLPHAKVGQNLRADAVLA